MFRGCLLSRLWGQAAESRSKGEWEYRLQAELTQCLPWCSSSYKLLSAPLRQAQIPQRRWERIFARTELPTWLRCERSKRETRRRQSRTSMASLLDNIARPSAVILQLSVLLGVIFVLLKVLQFYQERKKLIKALEAFPGPPKHWLYGHNHLVRSDLGSARVGLAQLSKISVRMRRSG